MLLEQVSVTDGATIGRGSVAVGVVDIERGSAVGSVTTVLCCFFSFFCSLLFLSFFQSFTVL